MKFNLQLLVLFCLLTPQWCDFNLYAAVHSGQLPVKRISLNKSEEMIGEAFSLVVPRENMIAVKVMVMGLKPGSWSIRDVRGQIRFQAEVIQGKNSIYFHAPVGAYSITPDFIAH